MKGRTTRVAELMGFSANRCPDLMIFAQIASIVLGFSQFINENSSCNFVYPISQRNIIIVKLIMRASFAVSQHAVKHIISKTEEKISEREFIAKNMNYYSSNRMISLVNQLGDQLLTLPNELKLLSSDYEPNNPPEDTLMSLSNLQPVQQLPQEEEKAPTISDHKSTSRSNNKIIKGLNIKNGENNQESASRKEQADARLEKLGYDDGKEDSDITEIRKEKQKAINEQKELDRRRKQNHKQVRLSKQGVNFDYNGNLIQIKADKKQNLISKVVTPKIPVDEPEKKKADKMLRELGTVVKTYQVKEGQQSKTKKVSKYKDAETIRLESKPEILFSKIKNPIEVIQVKEGVKAIFNQNTVQRQRKKLTNEELLQSRSNRKLSKNQYARIKTSTLRSKPEPEEDLNLQQAEAAVKPTQVKEERPKSISTNLKKRVVTESQLQKIRVEDVVLKKQLIEREREEVTAKQARKVLDDRCSSQVKKKEELNRIDQYNLNYSRNKTQYSAMKKISDNDSVLPKIQTKTQTGYPKVREKLKEATSMRREVLKKFEETLRV